MTRIKERVKRITTARLADVARAASVSLSTASRALSNPELVHPRTRERIDHAVRMLEYVPHGVARALASKRSRTIGAVVPTIDNPIFSHSIQILQRTLGDVGYILLLASHEYDADTELKVTRALIERGVDGLVLVGSDHAPELYQLLGRSDLPFELIWTIDPDRHHYCVGFSNRLASIRITRHLLAFGHRRFAVISGFTAHNDRARDRSAGVREALAAHALELPSQNYIETAFSVSNGRAAFVQLLSRDPTPTAIMCGNDLLAYGVLLECQARNIAVPEHMSVAGYDDIELAAEVSPPLTTIRIPTGEIGRRAAERLVARIAGKRVTRVEDVGAELIVRGSTGAAPR